MITFLDKEIVETDDYDFFHKVAECLKRNHFDFQYKVTEDGIRQWHVYVKKKAFEEAEYVLHLDHVL